MTPISYEICQLGSSDLNMMHAMLRVFGEAFDDVETYGAARPSPAYFERLLGKEHFIALAALKKDTVVGGLAAYELHKFEQERSEIYIYDLAVSEAHRREGIATALIEGLKGLRPHGAPMSSLCRQILAIRLPSSSIKSLGFEKKFCTSILTLAQRS